MTLKPLTYQVENIEMGSNGVKQVVPINSPVMDEGKGNMEQPKEDSIVVKEDVLYPVTLICNCPNGQRIDLFVKDPNDDDEIYAALREVEKNLPSKHKS